MIDTPRTDHAWRGREAQDYADSAHVVSLDLARTLERELIVCEALLEKTEKAHEAALKEAVAKERYLWLLALGKTVTLDDAKAVEEWVHNRRETAARGAA